MTIFPTGQNSRREFLIVATSPAQRALSIEERKRRASLFEPTRSIVDKHSCAISSER